MPTSNKFDIKDPGESRTLTFDLSLDLAAGETLVSVTGTTVTVVSGTDPSPTAILNGAASIDSSQTKALVPVKGGLDEVDYDVKVTVTTTNSTKVLVGAGILPVRNQ